MSRTECTVIVALLLAIVTIVAVGVISGRWHNVKMAELGYEQDVKPGTSNLVWVRSRP